MLLAPSCKGEDTPRTATHDFGCSGHDGPTPSTAEVVGEDRLCVRLVIQFLFVHGTDSPQN